MTRLRSDMLASDIRREERRLGRDLTQEEKDILADHVSDIVRAYGDEDFAEEVLEDWDPDDE